MIMSSIGRSILLVFALVSSLAVMAQKGMQDVVYLKNGSVIRGMVIEQVPGVSIKVETADKSVFVYPMNEVEKITKEAAVKSSVTNSGLGKGYEGLVQVGYGIGVGLYGEDRAKFNFINGYRFNSHLMTGIGLGVRAYTGLGETELFVPFFLHVRYTPLIRKISPYVAVDFGTSFNASADFRSEGIMLNSGLGVSIRTGESTALLLGFSLDLQKRSVYEEMRWGYYRAELVERSVTSSALSFNVGFSF